MINRKTKALLGMKAMAGLAIAFAMAANPVKAEDPLLGEIKAIKCVGCQEGQVTLVVHDPIDVRDFDMTIPVSDYSKIVTPLPGKRIFDHGDGCFYWNEAPKADKKVADKDAGKKAEAVKKRKRAQPLAKDSASLADHNAAADEDAPADVNPSKCIPFVRVPLPKVGKQD